MKKLPLLALFAILLSTASVLAQTSPAKSGPNAKAESGLNTGSDAAVSSDKEGSPDLTKQPTLYVVGYAHLDTEWRWEYPQVIDEYIRKTMEDNFKLFEKYPHYIFNFSGANRYRFMKEYFPADFAKVKKYVDEGRWFPAGSSMEEGDVNAPNAEAIIRQILYGNEWFRKEFGKASAEYMLPDCFGFPASLPTILAHSGVKGFSTQKLVWGSSAPAGGPESIEKTPEGTPFDVGVWVGPDGESVLAGINPGSYSAGIETDLSKPLPPEPANPTLEDLQAKIADLQKKLQQAEESRQPFDQKQVREYITLRSEQRGFTRNQRDHELERYQDDWATRVEHNGNVSGVFTDYHYYGTGDIGGTPDENSVKRLEAIVTKGTVALPPQGQFFDPREQHPEWPAVKVGEGPVHVISSTADQMFFDITPAEAAELPRYTGEMELTNHSAGSLTSQAYQKRWLRKEELLADAAEKSSIAAEWLGARPYPMERLNNAWTLVMGGHFHDIAAGTATPKSYEFAWNDDVIAMNQFAGVLNNATEAVAAALDTQTKGVPLVVFNPLNIVRQDIVEAKIDFPGGMPAAVRVTGSDGKDVPAQISDGKILFAAQVPSVGYAVYDVQPGSADKQESQLRVSKDELENEYYRVKLNSDGDVDSIYDKTIGKELLSAPHRLAISYDNPRQWPAWNMDWDQEQARPNAYVSGPAQIRVVEQGPVRVAIEVTRETAGSRFVQTVSLAAGDAGKRVEFGNVIDWDTRESNLKATFLLTASNHVATYNWDIGTIERPTAEPKKFEVPSHQWIDLTDASGEFGATVLTDCKNGSDKPTDNTIRLTLIRTPGTAGGYADQGTQDIGHHEFVYGISGHAAGWRESQTDWEGQRLNSPLVAFETSKHSGSLGRVFSLVKISNPRVRFLALKKAEEGDETILRMVELDGEPQKDVQISFAAPITEAREVNGQEQLLGAATVKDGILVTSFGAYQPRTFALRLATPSAKVPAVNSVPVSLHYDIATATNDGDRAQSGFDGKGNAFPAEMLPSEITFNGVRFQLPAAKTNVSNAVVAKGQTIELPHGPYDRIYLLATSANGDQKATFDLAGKKVELNIEDWSGFVGQWDERQWTSQDTSHDDYGDMIGLKRGYIKRADLAWYCNHHHNASGVNAPYAYSYLFAYEIDSPENARTIKLPNNPNVRIFAISAAEENPETKPVQPLYDVLPSGNAGPADYTLSSSSKDVTVAQGRSVTTRVVAMPRGSFDGTVTLNATGLPKGVTATFSPATTSGASILTFKADSAAVPTAGNVTITAQSGSISRTAAIDVNVTQILKNTVAVDLNSAYNITGIYSEGSQFAPNASLDGDGYAFSEQLLGREQIGEGAVFRIGPPNAPDVLTSKNVSLPSGKFSSARILAVGVNGSQELQTFAVTYDDGTSSSITQSLSDWAYPRKFSGESIAFNLPYRLVGDGSKDARTFYVYSYSINLDHSKTVRSISLPDNREVLVFGITLVP